MSYVKKAKAILAAKQQVKEAYSIPKYPAIDDELNRIQNDLFKLLPIDRNYSKLNSIVNSFDALGKKMEETNAYDMYTFKAIQNTLKNLLRIDDDFMDLSISGGHADEDEEEQDYDNAGTESMESTKKRLGKLIKESDSRRQRRL